MSGTSVPAGAGGEAEAGRRGGFPLFRVRGIQIRLDYSWLVIFFLVWWSLSAGYFPHVRPGEATATYWMAGLLGTLLFFASILVHELSHSVVAQRAGLEVPSITLFLFGGVSEMREDAKTPKAEFWIAVVGPLASFALALLFGALYGLLEAWGDSLTRSVVGYLAWINAALGLFNLLPGMPLDGGRVLRAAVWHFTGSVERGSRIAADAGKGLAFGLMALGALQIFTGNLIGGLWLILIGMFLRTLAGASYRSLVLRSAIQDVPVERFMIRDVVTVPAEASVRELVDDYILGRGFRGFPVVRGGRVVGVVSIESVKEVPEAERGRARVEAHMTPLSEAAKVRPDARLDEVLERMAREDLGRVLVMRGDALLGMITRTGIGRLVSFREALSGA